MPTKAQLNEYRNDIDKALAEVATKHNFDKISLGKISYSDSGFKAPVEVIFAGGDSKELKYLKHNAMFIGFEPTIANAEITFCKKQFKVIGLARSNLILEDKEGKTYNAKIEQVLNELTRNNSPHVHKLETKPHI